MSDFNDDLNSIYYFKYHKNPFYLVINDLKGYFKEKDKKELEFIMEDQEQANIYNQIWNKINLLTMWMVLILDLAIILGIVVLLNLILMILCH